MNPENAFLSKQPAEQSINNLKTSNGFFILHRNDEKFSGWNGFR